MDISHSNIQPLHGEESQVLLESAQMEIKQLQNQVQRQTEQLQHSAMQLEAQTRREHQTLQQMKMSN